MINFPILDLISFFNYVKLNHSRGLCEGTKIDRKYTLQLNRSTGHSFWKGFAKSKIDWNPDTENYQLKAFGREEVLAEYNKTSYFPVGLRTWWLLNDTCDEFKPRKVTLLLTQCKNDEFSCSDGSCIKMTQKCDRNQNCEDGSDELSCEEILDSKRVGRNYKSHVPPKNESGGYTDVSLSVNISKISDIQEVSKTISLKFAVTLQWFDNRNNIIDLFS